MTTLPRRFTSTLICNDRDYELTTFDDTHYYGMVGILKKGFLAYT